VNRDDQLTTIRGRVAFATQLAKNGLLPLPVHVNFDEFTEDILENRLIKSAGRALLRLPSVPHRTRRRLLQLDAFLENVKPVERPREALMPRLTRLNRRYSAALRLATLILRGASIDAPLGEHKAVAYTFDMNIIFEDFVTTAISEALSKYRGQVKAQHRDWLDRTRHLPIRPDITFWRGQSCVAIADAKYKRIASTQYPNADGYQMLAYCTALKQPRGYLIYAAQSGEEPSNTFVRNANIAIAVRTLDVALEPSDLLSAVDALADEIAAASHETVLPLTLAG
jgi:5-methylcytosine-specific restriction enzyme subunit McrC